MSNTRTPALCQVAKIVVEDWNDPGRFSCRLCGPNRPPLAQKSSSAGVGRVAIVTGFSGTGHDLKGRTPVPENRQTKADSAGLLSLLASAKRPGAIRVDGYLRVPADGVYAIHLGCLGEFRLSMGGVPVMETFRGCSLMPETCEVKLSAGWYPVTLEYFLGAESRIPMWMTADWEGPGLPRQEFIPAVCWDGI